MDYLKSVLKSRGFMFVVLGLFSLFLACAAQEYDYDLFARLIVGEHFFANGSVAYQDFLSYTPTHTWFDHEYGASLFFYFLFKHLGAFGLVLSQAILLFMTTFWVIKTQELQKKHYPPTIIYSVIFLLLLAHLNPFIVRCHMFSFMFFAMLIYILEKTRLYNSKIIYTVPFLMIIWNNIHGGVVAGLGTILVYMIGEILNKKAWKKYLVVLALSLPLLTINPWGLNYLGFLLYANTKNRSYITEWWSVFAIKHLFYYFSTFIFALFFLILASIRKINITKLFVLIVTAVLGTIHVKLLSLSLIACSALCYNEVMSLFNKNLIRNLNKFACIFCILTLLYLPFGNIFTARVNIYKFPILETEFIKINNIQGNILTTFGLGSYVAYKLYPQNLIYMDGRYEECYNDNEFQHLMNYEKGNYMWEKILYEYPNDILMPGRNFKTYKILKKHPDWIEIFDGPVCGIFVRKNIAKNNYIQPNNHIDYYKKTFFNNFGEFGKKQRKRIK